MTQEVPNLGEVDERRTHDPLLTLFHQHGVDALEEVVHGRDRNALVHEQASDFHAHQAVSTCDGLVETVVFIVEVATVDAIANPCFQLLAKLGAGALGKDRR